MLHGHKSYQKPSHVKFTASVLLTSPQFAFQVVESNSSHDWWRAGTYANYSACICPYQTSQARTAKPLTPLQDI